MLTRIFLHFTGCMYHTENRVNVLQKNIFCLALRFVLKSFGKFSVVYFSHASIYSWDPGRPSNYFMLLPSGKINK